MFLTESGCLSSSAAIASVSDLAGGLPFPLPRRFRLFFGLDHWVGLGRSIDYILS